MAPTCAKFSELGGARWGMPGEEKGSPSVEFGEVRVKQFQLPFDRIFLPPQRIQRLLPAGEATSAHTTQDCRAASSLLSLRVLEGL